MDFHTLRTWGEFQPNDGQCMDFHTQSKSGFFSKFLQKNIYFKDLYVKFKSQMHRKHKELEISFIINIK